VEDLFYFTRSAVRLQDLAALADGLGHRSEIFPGRAGDLLNVYYRERSFWQWIPIDVGSGDAAAFDDRSREVLAGYGPTSAFIIAHRVMSWPILKVYLKGILAKYGGWVGSDRDGWEPIYTVESIDHAPYPSYIQAVAYQAERGATLED
jgi:hypothetical protein